MAMLNNQRVYIIRNLAFSLAFSLAKLEDPGNDENPEKPTDVVPFFGFSVMVLKNTPQSMNVHCQLVSYLLDIVSS